MDRKNVGMNTRRGCVTKQVVVGLLSDVIPEWVMGTEKRRVRVGKVLKAEMESADIDEGRVTGRSLFLPEIQIGFYSVILE